MDLHLNLIKRTIDKRLSTPAVALYISRLALEHAKLRTEGSLYPLITARVFTAFAVEGVIHHLGQTLCTTWDKARNNDNLFHENH